MKAQVCEKYAQLNHLKIFGVYTKECKRIFNEKNYLISLVLKKEITLQMKMNGQVDVKSLANYDAVALVRSVNKVVLLPIVGGELCPNEEMKDRLKVYIKPNFLIHKSIIDGWYNDLENISKIESEFERSLFAK